MLDDASLKMYNECMDALMREIAGADADADADTQGVDPVPIVDLIVIKCNDCGGSNRARNHPLAIKCPDCGSYNTN